MLWGKYIIERDSVSLLRIYFIYVSEKKLNIEKKINLFMDYICWGELLLVFIFLVIYFLC